MKICSSANLGFFILLVLFKLSLIQSAKICVFSVVGFMNYRSGYDTLLESLIDKGHDVTLFSTLPLRVDQQYATKIRHINPKSVSSHVDSFFSFVSPLEWRETGKGHVLWDMLPILTLDLCNIILQDKETQQWLQSEKHYDLFIVDSAWNECGIGMAHAFQSKLILFSFHTNLLPWNLDTFGAVGEVSWIPDAQYESNYPMSYFQKLHFTFRTFRWYVYRTSFTFYQIRKFCRKFIDKDFPSIGELERNSSLVLVNSHFSEEYARSLPPVFVPVGGVHIRTEESHSFKRNLQSDLVKKVDSFVGIAASGFILVNIGCSKDTVKNLSPKRLTTILSAMQKSSLKFVFIWDENGSESKRLNTVSSNENILIIKECSVELLALLGRQKHSYYRSFSSAKFTLIQFVVLQCCPIFLFLIAHPKIKGLVSHGDLLDVQEAIYHAVPLILLPVVFEQDANAERIERLGRGIRLEIIALQEDELSNALNRLITNSTYKTNMKTASLAFRDRQVKPLDSSVWWIEHILRNSDTSPLKPLGIHQTWYSRRSLDVWFLILFCIFLASELVIIVLSAVLFKSITCKILLKICNCYCNRNEICVKYTDKDESQIHSKAGNKKFD